MYQKLAWSDRKRSMSTGEPMRSSDISMCMMGRSISPACSTIAAAESDEAESAMRTMKSPDWSPALNGSACSGNMRSNPRGIL